MVGGDLRDWLSAWGAGLATILAAMKIWEVFLKDRVRLASSYSFTNQEGEPDEIIIVNLSPVPVQVASWSLVWRPTMFHWATPIDVTPFNAGRFKVEAKGSHTLTFDEDVKFEWGYRNAANRKLCLDLRIFGVDMRGGI
jgi:hypothetical protein